MQTVLMDEVLDDLLAKISKLTNREVFSKYQVDMNVVSKRLNKVVRSYDFLRNIDLDEGVLQLLKKKTRKERIKKQKVTDDELTLEMIDELFDTVEEKEKEEKKEDKKEEPNNENKKKRERKTNPNVGLVIEEPIPVSLGANHPAKRWVSIEKEDGTHLEVEINLDHPFYHNEEEVAALVRNVVLESVAEFILREEKRQVGMIEDEVDRLNRIKDMLIRHSIESA